MPLFVKQAALDRLNDNLEYYQRRAAQLDKLEPYIPLAQLLKEEVERLVDQPSIPAHAIGELAFTNVLEREVVRARKERAADYERIHRKELYARVLEEVDAKEGPALLEGVMQRLDTDAALVAELREKARKEVVARAVGIAAQHVTAEQEAAIQDEIQRQMALDRYDVAFAVNGEVDLTDETLTGLLKPDDRLVVMFKKDNVGQTGLGFNWRRDINNKVGWVMGQPVITSEQMYYRRYTQMHMGSIPTDMFIGLGAQIPDYTNRQQGIRPDTIVAGYPLAATWENNRGNTMSDIVKVSIRETEYAANGPVAAAAVSTIDFQARELVFAQGA